MRGVRAHRGEFGRTCFVVEAATVLCIEECGVNYHVQDQEPNDTLEF